MRQIAIRLALLYMPMIAAGISCGGSTEPGSGQNPPPDQNPPPGQNPPPPGTYGSTIAFVSERDGNPEIYTIDASGEHRLTNYAGKDVNPVWSPDGSRIAFERDGSLYTMRADGSDVIRITTPTASQEFDVRQNGVPLAATDGRLLYSRYGLGQVKTRMANFDGTNDHEIVPGSVATWSADGSLIAFNVIASGTSDVYLIRADGSGQRDLTNTPGSSEDWPIVSPDGANVAFVSSTDGMTVMSTNGNARKSLGVSTNVYRWSADGTKLAFRAPRAGTSDGFNVETINADGSGRRQLTNVNFFVNFIRWSSDGTRIAFDNGYGPGRSGHVYVVNIDGTGLTQITSGSVDYDPVWKP